MVARFLSLPEKDSIVINEKNATHIVTHPFDGGGKSYVNGDRVNASSFKNVAQLVTSKYLRPMTVVEAAQIRPVADTPKLAPVKKKMVLKKLFIPKK